MINGNVTEVGGTRGGTGIVGGEEVEVQYETDADHQ